MNYYYNYAPLKESTVFSVRVDKDIDAKIRAICKLYKISRNKLLNTTLVKIIDDMNRLERLLNNR